MNMELERLFLSVFCLPVGIPLVYSLVGWNGRVHKALWCTYHRRTLAEGNGVMWQFGPLS
jgi:hypothetical protein